MAAATQASAADGPLSLVVIDDLDRLLTRFDEDHRHAATTLLARLAHEGAPRSVALVASVRSSPAAGLAAAFPARLLLPLPSRDEHVLAGGAGPEFHPTAPPGRARWRGVEVQVATTAHVIDPVRIAPRSVVIGADVRAIVAPRPAALVARLAAEGVPALDLARTDATGGGADAALLAPGAPVVVGDVDSWQARWSLLAAVRRDAEMLYLDSSLSDLRAQSRTRQLPPPLAPTPGEGWLVDAAGIHRVRHTCGSELFST
ncbi:MAG: hypothetical protein ABW040_10960 [Microbacteriaceae bacterium]